MSSWVLSVCGTVFLTAVLYSVLPQGKTAKIIKSIFAIMCLTILLKPVFTLKNADFDYNALLSEVNTEFFYQEDFLNYSIDAKKRYLERGLSEFLKDKGVSCENVVIELVYDDKMSVSTKKVSVYIESGRIVGNDEHIDIIDKAYSYLSAFVESDKNLIEIL